MTQRVACVYTKAYLEDEDSTWCARPTSRLLQHIHQSDDNGSARWIAVLGDSRIALGDPVPNNTEYNLFLPGWFADSADILVGEEMLVRFERSEEMPRATRLVFKALGDIPEGIDVRELLEEPLSQLGVLRMGQIIPIPVLEGTLLLLETCEPDAETLFMDGAEIALEIIEDARPAAESLQRPPTPIPEPPQVLVPVHVPQPQPQLPLPRPIGRFANKNFVAFSGAGRRLCD